MKKIKAYFNGIFLRSFDPADFHCFPHRFRKWNYSIELFYRVTVPEYDNVYRTKKSIISLNRISSMASGFYHSLSFVLEQTYPKLWIIVDIYSALSTKKHRETNDKLFAETRLIRFSFRCEYGLQNERVNKVPKRPETFQSIRFRPVPLALGNRCLLRRGKHS